MLASHGAKTPGSKVGPVQGLHTGLILQDQCGDRSCPQGWSVRRADCHGLPVDEVCVVHDGFMFDFSAVHT
jgi:hypothetical protein